MIGDTIHMLRVSAGMSADELAAAAGVSRQAIEQYEANVWQPGNEVVINLAKRFGVTVQEIWNGYSLLYDDENREILLVRNMGGNKVRIVKRIQGNR